MSQVPGISIIAAIMNRQQELMVKYDAIESANGFNVPHPPFDIDHMIVQQRVKELCWRATEELGEAMEERHLAVISQTWREDGNGSLHHFIEELIDALHFFVEASIIVGITPAEIEHSNPIWSERDRGIGTVSTMPKITIAAGEFVWAMGIACNCLKNKAWRKTVCITDHDKFRRLWLDAWTKLGMIFALLGLTLDEIYGLYLDKHSINKQRQAGGY